MRLNKAILLSTLSLFICSACVSLGDNKVNQTQQLEINHLQTALMLLNQTSQQTQEELASIDSNLKNWQDKVSQLSELVRQKEPEKPAPVICEPQLKLNDKTIFGQVEWVYISKAKSNYKARIDTGAATSSISATDIKRFERDGQKWVRFTLSEGDQDNAQILEAKVERSVNILQSSRPGKTTSRPVIKLHVRIADIAYSSEFTLSDRSHMEYPILIGRSFIQDLVLVDVSKEYLHAKYTQQVKINL